MTDERGQRENPPGIPPRFEVGEVLGRGGFASVFKALDTATGKTVAIKMLHAQHVKDEAKSRRFEREIRVCQRLNHPNIIKVSSSVVSVQVAYLVMEFLDAKDLSVLLKERKFIIPEAFRIIAQVASALDYIHNQRLVHRDIKPENIMVSINGLRTVLTDFNLVRLPFRSSLSGMGDALGTPMYVAPEVVTGTESSSLSDIYAMGLVFYELLTGKQPYEQKAMGALLRAICNTLPPPPSEVKPGIGEALDKLVMRCIAKDPKERYPTAAEFLKALAKVDARGHTAVEAVKKYSPSLSGRAPLKAGSELLEFARSHPQTIFAASLVLLLLALLVFAVL